MKYLYVKTNDLKVIYESQNFGNVLNILQCHVTINMRDLTSESFNIFDTGWGSIEHIRQELPSTYPEAIFISFDDLSLLPTLEELIV